MNPDRPKQEVGVELVDDLMRVIRSQFCPDMDAKEWFKDHFHFIRKNVVMWPARFICGKGFTLPPERFKAILLGILNEVKAHGNTAAVKYWQFYLTTCVQRHFKLHWEEYYGEAKATRALAANALMGLGRLRVERGADVVCALALAHRVASPGRRVRGRGKAAKQMELI